MPTIDAEVSGEFGAFMAIADKHRKLKVRSNADIPRDAIKAREFGAEGIGLCRTEHMFFAEDRLPFVVQMIIAAPVAKAISEKLAAKEKALAGSMPWREQAERPRSRRSKKEWPPLMKSYKGRAREAPPFQRGLLRPLQGHGATRSRSARWIRRSTSSCRSVKTSWWTSPRSRVPRPRRRRRWRRSTGMTVAQLKKGMPEMLRRVEDLHEFNPMMGHRGCRLGITYPEVTEMQARAIFEAACQIVKEGGNVVPEVMIPLIGTVEELRGPGRDRAPRRRRDEEGEGVELEYMVGTMIEIPRAALTAARVAEEAEFFSFGTNDPRR